MPRRKKRAATVKSPCVNCCKMDDSGLCKGCMRTAAEIKMWKNASDPERLSILAEIETRRKVVR